MDWGSDELGHRSAAASGWAEELRAADPEDVDETVAGAVEFAAATVDDTGEAVADGAGAIEADTRSAVVADASGVAGAAAAAEAAAAEAAAEAASAETATDDVDGLDGLDAADGLDGADAADATGDATDDGADISPTFTCGFCRREVPEAEALDADGLPIGEFEWVADPDVGEREAYHRECVDAGEGRFLPWGASGALGDG